ncbi:molybdenum cofactor biosynthesis protein MoaE [Thioalkalivibrio sp. HK1]|uniref:molybdenum cofactor biosynthesis protein MoaE n=1 Tax=Thioalkalivibrio sp. HK1 TaxID=1469245 RepID=UPI00046EB9EC|nr:molybdenum cofactor biosynthesis protein MoaE [Thioalkalivibrio sp. HK1]
MTPYIRIQQAPFDAGSIIEDTGRSTPKTGAVAAFVGRMRDINVGNEIAQMTLEHYPGMTERAIEGICQEASERWDLLDIRVVHRTGTIKPLDTIVLVAVASAHRQNAFLACEFIMDFLKTRAPFWKKETTEDGTEHWVESRTSDDLAAERWHERTSSGLRR